MFSHLNLSNKDLDSCNVTRWVFCLQHYLVRFSFFYNFVTLKHSSSAEKLFWFNFDSLKSKMSCLNVWKSVNENKNSYISPSNWVDVDLEDENNWYRFKLSLKLTLNWMIWFELHSVVYVLPEFCQKQIYINIWLPLPQTA